jgi:putative membrane protein
MSVYRPVAAMFAVATLLSMSASVPVLAQSGAATSITHRQSVRTDMSPSGEIDASRVFTQLTVQGEGDVEVVLPDQATRSLRNLDAFGRPDIDGDQVTFSVVATPDGTHERTVATHSGPMPIELEVAYRLDGSTIAPEDLVGGSGQLEVSYTVRNTTAEPTEITYRDGVGAKHTETIDVAVPFVGSISMELDGRFVGIDAPGAAVAGNGRGDTFVSWSMVLFEPVGSEEQTVTYTAQVTDAIVPAVVAQFLPVDSNSFTSLASVEETFGAVADGLREIAGGGLQIDANLQALAIGAGQLLSGVTRLANGGERLADGLNETAIPGARQLAEGTGAASAGGAALASGLGELSSGAGELSAGSRHGVGWFWSAQQRFGRARSGAGPGQHRHRRRASRGWEHRRHGHGRDGHRWCECPACRRGRGPDLGRRRARDEPAAGTQRHRAPAVAGQPRGRSRTEHRRRVAGAGQAASRQRCGGRHPHQPQRCTADATAAAARDATAGGG